jgi:hypothetical protein
LTRLIIDKRNRVFWRALFDEFSALPIALSERVEFEMKNIGMNGGAGC